MPLFDVDPETKLVSQIPPTTFHDLKLWERRDLEAWVTSAPHLAGGDFTVVTSEYDRLLRRYCAAIPRGRWTTYGDLAAAVGAPGAALTLGTIVASDDQITTAHRILRSTGEISPSWASTEGGPEVARQRLEKEGVRFTPNGRADPTQRWTPTLADAGRARYLIAS